MNHSALHSLRNLASPVNWDGICGIIIIMILLILKGEYYTEGTIVDTSVGILNKKGSTWYTSNIQVYIPSYSYLNRPPRFGPYLALRASNLRQPSLTNKSVFSLRR